MATSFRLADHREYRRGVILGLTLAEILVLLVFLLLLASGAILARRDKQVVDLQAAVADYKALLQPIMARANQAGFDIARVGNHKIGSGSGSRRGRSNKG